MRKILHCKKFDIEVYKNDSICEACHFKRANSTFCRYMEELDENNNKRRKERNTSN